MVERFSVWLVNLNPTKGSEQAGFRPVVVVSPNSMNSNLNTVIVAPLTTKMRNWPTRIAIEHDNKQGQAALDQLRTLDKSRLSKPSGSLSLEYQPLILKCLQDIFAE